MLDSTSCGRILNVDHGWCVVFLGKAFNSKDLSLPKSILMPLKNSVTNETSSHPEQVTIRLASVRSRWLDISQVCLSP